MKRWALPLLVVAFAVIGGTAGFLLGGHVYRHPPAPPGVSTLAVGDHLPAVQLPDLDGQAHPLIEPSARLVVVNYWASWCPPCIEEMPLLEAFGDQHRDAGVRVVGVAEDEAGAVRDFLVRHPVRYRILLGGDGLDGSSLQLGNTRNVLPYTVLLDGEGRLLERHAGLLDRARLDGWLAQHAPR